MKLARLNPKVWTSLIARGTSTRPAPEFHTVPRLFFAASILAAFASFAVNSAAQKTENATSILQAIRAQRAPVIIDSLSLKRYEAALIPALADTIAEQDLVVAIESAPQNHYQLDSEWQDLLEQGGSRTLKDTTALPNPEHPRAPAFGSFEKISSESDSGVKAQKLLWNVASLFEANRFVEAKFRLSWSVTDSSQRQQISARILQAYPGTLKLGNAVALREIFEVLEPQWLSPFALLTLRQYGDNEDYLWIFSPTLLSSRELASSLRGDPLFGSLFSLDDMLVYSSKTEILDPTLSDSFETLVPLVTAAKSFTTTKSAQAGCREFSSPERDNANLFGSLYLTPRKVFLLELRQRDPFSLVGRQKLYVDAETMIPFFREVYGQDGTLIKKIIGAFNLINSGSNGAFSVVPHTIIATGPQGKVSTLEVNAGRVCAALPGDVGIQYFDPSQLDARAKAIKKDPSPNLKGPAAAAGVDGKPKQLGVPTPSAH